MFALIALVGTTQAQVGQVYFCASKNGHAIRIFRPPYKCRAGRQLFVVNQEGIRGEAGPAGASGPAGLPGAAGSQGTKGDTGSAGPEGAAGVQGVAGPEGPRGEKGETGSPGAEGSPGIPGPQGSLGSTGPTGPKGEKGEQGEKGEEGATPEVESVVMGGSSSSVEVLPGGAFNAKYLAASGLSTPGSEEQVEVSSPTVETTAKDLFVRIVGGPSTIGQDMGFGLGVNGNITLLRCAVDSGYESTCTADTTVSIPAEASVSFEIFNDGEEAVTLPRVVFGYVGG